MWHNLVGIAGTQECCNRPSIYTFQPAQLLVCLLSGLPDGPMLGAVVNLAASSSLQDVKAGAAVCHVLYVCQVWAWLRAPAHACHIHLLRLGLVVYMLRHISIAEASPCHSLVTACRQWLP